MDKECCVRLCVSVLWWIQDFRKGDSSGLVAIVSNGGWWKCCEAPLDHPLDHPPRSATDVYLLLLFWHHWLRGGQRVILTALVLFRHKRQFFWMRSKVMVWNKSEKANMLMCLTLASVCHFAHCGSMRSRRLHLNTTYKYSYVSKVHSRSVDPQKNHRNFLITRSILEIPLPRGCA